MLPPIKNSENYPADRPEHVGVMQLSALMGELLLKNGGEIYRVQDTLNRIIDACGFPNHNVFVISNGIFMTINEGMPDACSSVRYVPLGSVNLENIASLNQISRDICSGNLTRDEAYEQLLLIQKPAPENKALMTLACGFASAGFCVLFGGTLSDGTAAFLVGLLLQVILYGLSGRRLITRFPSHIIAAFCVTMASALCMLTGLPLHFDRIVIGAIIPLVPGYSLTTSIRDFFNSDFLSGLIHLLDAVCLALCIAVGVGSGVKLIAWLGGGFVL